MAKTIVSPIVPTDRVPDGNLTREARARTLNEIRKHVSRMGYVNVSALAEQFDVSRQTMRSLLDEALKELRARGEMQILAQIHWHEEGHLKFDRQS